MTASIEETETLLRYHKTRHAQALADGEEVSPQDLMTIHRLEARLASLTEAAELRELTAEPEPVKTGRDERGRFVKRRP